MADREDLEKKITDAEAARIAAEEEIQQQIGEEQLRTSPDPSHEKIRLEKELPTPDPDKLAPEDGGNQLDPEEIDDHKEDFDKADLDDPRAVKEAKKEVLEDKAPTKPATLGGSKSK